MMQSLHNQQHQQQQQLAALLAAALPKETSSSSSTPTPTTTTATSSSEDNDSSAPRISAITSLHRAILYPPNSLLVNHSASFLFHGFSQLLSDKSSVVRQAAATAYGALCGVLCSVPVASNVRQNHALINNLVDRFMGWALPLLRVEDGMAELALESLREFLSVGDIGAVERYVLPVLKACQQILEDERTSLSLLHRILGVLTLISLKFFRCFQTHFVDIVDLLLGWAMVPDLADPDRRIIMDSFLQFQKHWVNNLHFSLDLLSKFLGDMDVLLQDASPGTHQQYQRLLVLLFCFSTVLQSTASGLLEINLLEQIWEPLAKMLPTLLAGLSMVGKKFGWSKWIGESWRCLTLLAEILGEKFSSFYSSAVDILFQSLEMDNTNHRFGVAKMNSFQIHGVLRTNLQLLSLQKHGLLPSSARKILQFYAPISQLRLHPNHLVTGSSAAAYMFLLQHRNNEVVEQAITTLIEELQLLKSLLQNTKANAEELDDAVAFESYSCSELFAFLKFDLKVLLCCVSLGGDSSLIGQPEIVNLHISRSQNLIHFIIENLSPFEFPIQDHVELQANIVNILGQLTAVNFLNKCSARRQKDCPGRGLEIEKVLPENSLRDRHVMIIFEHLEKYSVLLVNALHLSSPLVVKLEAVQWIQKFCESVIGEYEKLRRTTYPCQMYECANIVGSLLISLLDAASDKEPKVRSHVPIIIRLLLQARLVHSTHFGIITEVVLERLGDPDKDVRHMFVKLLSDMLPMTLYACGMCEDRSGSACTSGIRRLPNRSNLHWKQIFALKQLPQQLHSQQLVSVLSYISQRWKVPLSSWIQRLIYTCRRPKDIGLTQLEEAGHVSVSALWWDKEVEENILERICSVNILASAWWAIHEAARYCISTRLRTNLGGPTQTFAALERMLLDIALVLHVDSEQSDGNLKLVGSSYAHLLPLRLLLDFVEALKKNVYNAYDGSIVLAPASRQSSLFFRANKKVCEEWFSRICEPMMNAGLSLQCHDATVHYCTLRLQELSNQVATFSMEKNFHNTKDRFLGDVLRILRHMALALCRMHESEALIGLQKWASMTFFSLFTQDNCSLVDHEIARPLSWIMGLKYQAEGQYEKAAAHFTHLLQMEDSLSTMGSDGVHFAIARIVESYDAISDWKSLDSWLSELHKLRAKHVGKSYSGALTMAGIEMNAINAMAHFDEGDYQAAWAYLDLTPKSSSELTLDPKLALQRSEQMLLQAMLFHNEGMGDKVSTEIQKAKSMLDEALSVLPLDGLAEAAAHVSQLHCISALEENCNVGGVQDNQLQSILSSYIQAMQSPINQVHQDCKLWLKVLRVYRSILPTAPVTLLLCKNLLTLARTQSNLMLANRLNNYLRHHILNCSKEGSLDFMIPSMEYEGILLMHAEKKFESALINLWAFVKPCLISPTETVSDADDNFLLADACLKFSDWVRQNCSDTSMEDFVLQLRAELNVNESSPFTGSPNCNDDNLSSRPRITVFVEELAGTLKKLSTSLCPTMGRSWISYASWCFNQAKANLFGPHEAVLESCSFSPNLNSDIIPDRFKLTEEELTKVRNIVSEHLIETINPKDSGQVQEVCDFDTESSENHPREVLVQQVINIIEAAAGAPGAEDVAGECFSTTLASRLQKCFQIDSVGTESTRCLSFVDDLLDVWLSLRSRRVSLFGQAAQAYINYLRYSSLVGSDGQLPVCGSNLLQKSESHSLRATLYVLHILLNYGVELKDTLEPALATVPLLPWQEITPQLFARVSFHPEQVVRKQLEGMLIMLAKLSPWSVVYPTLVDVNSYEEEPPEELQHILACLSKLYPRLIQDVQLTVKELENVTILWEELWLTTLQDLHTDVIRRINLLKEEAARIAENTTLSQTEKNKINAAKYSAMMAPIFVALERRLASTSRKPETPHEIWFHQEYKEQIKMAVLNFKTPPATASALGDVWRPFDIIAASLASYQRKSSISLGDVAPQLAQLSSSDVPMPGLEKQITISDSDKEPTSALQGIVTIASFSEDITILPTKTRPKKLVIMGSDGQTYPYLLKGREDLRLDARIMQLLQAINGFLHSPSSTCDQVSRIRYYSVTPISGRAGLIQWVDNVTSIYSVFKSWQSRVQFAQHSALASNTKNSVPPPVPRPSDMFYGKIIPALKEKGLRRVISRRDWPHEVKRKVFLDLVKETPKQLLHQELWCASEGFKAFSSKLKRYSSSLAAMSMIGHILGLGDRHLDNILMDFCSGEIVHIDYNVCFDKGQRLKIPEIVPFRLTQTMEAALGLTGVEGTFRASCEAVLTVLKNNKDMLLMLLEVFVWDPLVEWTRGDFHDDAAIVGEERKGMELAVSLSLFASRVQEMRVPLQDHHDLLVASFPAIESALMRFTNILNEYESIFTLFSRADKERSNILHRETSARSIVVEATNNLEKTRVTYDMQAQELAQAKALVAEKAEEAATWIEQHGKVIDGIRSSSIPEIKASINLSGKEKILSLTSAVLVAGVPLTVVPEPTQVQCHEIDREVSLLMSELDYGLTSAVTCLQTYSLALQRVLPLNYLSTSPVHNWAQVLHLLLNTISSDLLSLAKRQAAEHNLKGHVEGIDSVKSCYDDLCQKVEKYGEGIKKLEEERLELVNSIGSGTELAANDHLLSTFISYMQSTGLGNEDPLPSLSFGLVKHERTLDSRFEGKIEEKEKIITILNIAVSSLYSDVKHRVLDIFNHTPDGRHADTGTIFCKFEEQVEKCVLLAGFVNEVQQYIESNAPTSDINLDSSNYSFSKNWAAIFKTSLISCKGLAEKLLDAVLPDAIRAVISFSSEVMDSFGSLSQIRGSIDTALEDLIQVEIERASLADLVQSYFLNVGLVTEQQLALEEAALKGRDHLSWEEAEELASQEEACRAQLDKLHHSWNQKDMRTSSLVKRESSIKSALLSAEHHIQSLCSNEQDRDPQNSMSKSLLVSLMQPFFELESVDKALSSFVGPVSSHLTETLSLKDLASSGCPLSEYVWKLSGILNSRSFFIWKVVMIDSFLNSCIHDAASSAELNLGFDQLVDNVRKKLERQLQGHLNQYLRERVAPIFLARLDTETELLKQNELSAKLIASDDLKKEFGAVKRVKLMLEEYCNAHETVRAATSAASLMNKQVNELRESLLKTTLDIVQMEWIHDHTLNPMRNYRLISHKFLASMDNLLPVILNLSRPKLLESIQSSVAKIARSLEGLQACEQNSVTAERQLERAMGWACGASNSSSAGNTSAKNTGIPPEFHDHLLKRGQLLLEVREKGSEMIKVCMSVLEFEASRDGIFRKSGELYPPESGADATIWQQIYSYALTRLDATYHSFMCTEEEWQLAQRNMETASRNLSSASNELSVTSVKAKSAADNLQRTLIAMKDCASEASVVLSAFARVTRGHAALTAECGSMLDEVLAITDGLHDVHSLGKEAAALHMSLMEDLSKANTILLPLESVLSKDVAAMTDAMEREKETKMEISPIHGQAIHQSYYSRIKEAFQSYEPLVPSLTSSVKGLHLMLSRLARVASLHSGNLHKALEGLRESKEISSEDVNVSRPDLEDNDQEFDNNDVSVVPQPYRDYDEDSLGMNQLSIQDKGWISPPDSIYTSSSESGELSDEAVADNHGGSDLMEQCSNGHGSKTNDNIMSSVSESMQSVSLVKSIESPSHSLGSQEADVKVSERALSSQYKVEGNITDAPPSMDTNTRVTRGKNAYAVSILRRVEMKLDGQDIASNREISIAEQVDHLIKQATSIDNLCNMYEGWTPWI